MGGIFYTTLFMKVEFPLESGAAAAKKTAIFSRRQLKCGKKSFLPHIFQRLDNLGQGSQRS
jgi:hypothetical protein